MFVRVADSAVPVILSPQHHFIRTMTIKITKKKINCLFPFLFVSLCMLKSVSVLQCVFCPCVIMCTLSVAEIAVRFASFSVVCVRIFLLGITIKPTLYKLNKVITIQTVQPQLKTVITGVMTFRS